MEKTISFKSNQVFYKSAGSGDPIIWIHGGGVDHAMWQKQLEYFAKTHQVVAYDLRGHGRSTYSDNSEPDIRDLEVLLDSLDIENAHLVGLSLGAIMAIDFTLAFPNRVRKLVLLSPGLIGVQEKEKSYLDAVGAIGVALQNNEKEKAIQAIVAMTFSPELRTTRSPKDPMINYVVETATNYIEKENYKRLPQIMEPNPLSRLSTITHPTLLIHGGKDLEYMQTNVAVLKDSIPGASAIEYPNASHLLNWEMAMDLNRDIMEFLSN